MSEPAVPDLSDPEPSDAISHPAPEALGAGLVLACLGVVFGDIGTSPLYALRESLVHAHEHHMAETAVIGIVSMLFWTVVLIVTIKYVTLILRADNNGEGGTLSLVAKAQGARGRRAGGFMRGCTARPPSPRTSIGCRRTGSWNWGNRSTSSGPCAQARA